MTNEEKAKEIASKYERWNQEDDESFGAYNGAMEMAEFKEKQFIMIIEKIIDLFDKYPSNAVFSKNNVIEMFETLKIAMEEEITDYGTIVKMEIKILK